MKIVRLRLPALAAACIGSALADTPLTVTVSALNYDSTPKAQWYSSVRGDANSRPTPPPMQPPDKPLFYAVVPGQLFPNPTKFETVYKQVAIALARRGYFDAVQEIKAGRKPNHMDLLIRLDCGVRFWKNPVVRTDHVTWGDAALVSKRSGLDTLHPYVRDWREDERSGQDPIQAGEASFYLRQASQSNIDLGRDYLSNHDFTQGAARDFAVILIQAFRYSEVRDMKDKAPCLWGTFVAVPLEAKQTFADVLNTMMKVATPYLGETARGVQVYDDAHARVILGEPVEVKDSPAH